MEHQDQRAGLHPIQVAVRRSGVSADVLRAWEKRYGAVTPVRSETGRRLYSDADIERLRLIKEAMAGGRRIGDVARLPTPDLQRPIAEDGEQERTLPRAAELAAVEPDFINEALGAIRRGDQPQLRAALSRALLFLAPTRFIQEVATPLMHEVGRMWELGQLTPGHEHAATEVMRQLLTQVLAMLRPANGARRLVVGTPSGQRHEIGALLAATTAALANWHVTYLGPDLPAADIARIALDTQAAAVALSITASDPDLGEEIVTLRKTLGRDFPVLVGGQYASQLDGALARGATIRDLESFKAALQSLPRDRLGEQ
jgi:DNA-binding transcriptional MerR regulator/methylmalonyl-CoA mutase cobalamin-binding subunit